MINDLMKQAKQEHYGLRFNCTNCGHVFSKLIPFGVDVTDGNGVRRDISFAGNELITCPNCGSTKISKSW